ncbi:DMT family transporter [Cellulomonas sp. NPDC058312]|uniref:EamA family transporter n=1 Tax=Cellulomonas sp. NPDC058312 TaxID=3346441 RepID=UPI0036E4D4AB
MLTLLPGARRRALLAAALVLVGSTAVQLSAALAAGTFADLGTLAVSGYRMTAAAVVLLLLTRPRLRGRDRRTWAAIVLYGVAMAAMNVLFYAALDRLPLGVAVTLEFCGPLLIAAVASAGRTRVLPFVALLGVLLVVGGPAGGVDPLGVLLGLGAAAAFGAYTLLAGRVGDASTGLGDLALSVGVGALLLAPAQVAAAPDLTSGHVPALLASGVLGVALAFSLDFQAVRLAGTRVVGTLFAVDPAMGAVVGALLLGDRLTGPALGGLVLVVLAGAGVVWSAGRPRRDATPAT